jgi:5'-nucleotidase / UDP-sugar diphosphatase
MNSPVSRVRSFEGPVRHAKNMMANMSITRSITLSVILSLTLSCTFFPNVCGSAMPAEQANVPSLARMTAASASAGSAEQSFDSGRELFTVLHTNDVHGLVTPDGGTGGFSSFLTLVFLERGRSIASGLPVFVFDSGDFFQGTPLGDFTQGKGIIEVMNKVGYDACTIGNHEFDVSLAGASELFKMAAHPIVVSNLRNPSGRKIPGTVERLLVKKGSLKLGVFALMTPSLPLVSGHPDAKKVRILDPAKTAKKEIRRLKAMGADIVICLSHLGVEDDLLLASSVKGIDIILGGHSHTGLSEPKKANGTLIFQEGAYGKAAGRYRFAFDFAKLPGSRLELLKYELVPLATNKMYANLRTLEDVKKFTIDINKKMDAPLGETKVELIDMLPGEFADQPARLDEFINARKTGLSAKRLPSGEYMLLETNLGNLVCDLTRKVASADIALTNFGGLRSRVPAGKISVGGLYKVLPFNNTIVKMTLRGEEVMKILEVPGRTRLRTPVISGLRIVYGLDSKGDLVLKRAEINGKPLNPAGRYTFAVNSFISEGGDGYDSIAKVAGKTDTGAYVRDVVTEYLKTNSPIEPTVDGRVIVE